MRVAVVTESFLPSANGVTTSVLRVLDHLSQRGHEGVVVCPGPAPSRYAGRHGDWPVVTVPAVTLRGFRLGVPTRTLVRALDRARADVLHAASPFVLGAHALAHAGRCGLPSVAVFQTDVAGFARRHGLGAARAPVWRWLRTVHRMADLTLAPSSSTMADLAAAGIDRTALWGRGVDAAGFHPGHRTSPAGRRLRAALAAGDRVVVGYVGRVAPEKSPERLVPLARLPGVRLVVVGDGPSLPWLRRRLAGTDAVLTGRLDGVALATAYAALDVFVHPGTEETFGQTLQEAMASAVPVVAPAAGGPLDVVADGVSGLLVAPGDEAALTRAVGTLAADPVLRARAGEAGRRLVLPRSWTRAGDELLGHYRTVLAPGAVARPAAGSAAGAQVVGSGPTPAASPGPG
ncbi:glycosyltransferase family 4 protein [Thalassiella azotivora]